MKYLVPALLMIGCVKTPSIKAASEDITTADILARATAGLPDVPQP